MGRKKLVLLIMVAVGLFCTSCDLKNSDEAEVEEKSDFIIEENGSENLDAFQKDEEELPKFEGIDVSKLDENQMQKGEMTMIEMVAKGVTIRKVCVNADVIIKGRLISLQPHDGLDGSSKYTFKISEVYKGEAKDEISIVTLGGVTERDGIYILDCPEGFEPLSPDGEYVIFASKSKTEDYYHPTYFFYGIFKDEVGNGEYVRYQLEEDVCENSFTIDELKGILLDIPEDETEIKRNYREAIYRWVYQDESEVAEEGVAQEETGYPSGKVQEMSLFVNNSLYKQTSSTIKYYNKTENDIKEYSNYKFYGSVIEDNNEEIPSKDLYASRIEEGAKVYVNQENDSDILLYMNDTIFFLQKK